MIASGLITKRADQERMPAQSIERDYVLAHVSAEIGLRGDARIVLKGGTLLLLLRALPLFRRFRFFDRRWVIEGKRHPVNSRGHRCLPRETGDANAGSLARAR